MSAANKNVIWFEDLSRGDVGLVGGKNSSLGEMVQQLGEKGIDVPPGFATTSDAFRAFIKANNLNEVIADAMEMLDSGKRTLAETGTAVRAAIVAGDWPDDIREAILSAYRELSERTGNTELSVAVRSSATAEDLPDASFAGQQETYLNVRGEAALLSTCRRCYASLFTDRAITYRKLKGFDHNQVALSIGVQLMVRSDIGVLRRDVLHRHRIRLRQGGADQCRLGPGRERGPGRRGPPTNTRCSSRCSTNPASSRLSRRPAAPRRSR
jgi:pyruvate,water dikinase